MDSKNIFLRFPYSDGNDPLSAIVCSVIVGFFYNLQTLQETLTIFNNVSVNFQIIVKCF